MGIWKNRPCQTSQILSFLEITRLVCKDNNVDAIDMSNGFVLGPHEILIKTSALCFFC